MLQKLEIYKFEWWYNYWSWNFTSIEDRKCNPMINVLKFNFNKKNIEWSYNLSLQQSLLPNFV